jgi:hypothetical protein
MIQRILSLVVCLLLAFGPAMAQEPVGELSTDEIVERIEMLRRELDALLAALPSRLREEQAGCAALGVFDSNGDDSISGLDRYWRYFKLWIDDGDGVIELTELSGLYDAGVAGLSTSLRSYIAAAGDSGDVWVGQVITLDLLGKTNRQAVLVIDADRLARGGELELRDSADAALTGWQALGAATRVFSSEGDVRPLLCP